MSLIRSAEDETCSLPEDLLSSMLLRMPWQHVFEFRRLSKYYKELIDSPSFTEKHYDILIKTRPNVIVHERRHRVSESHEGPYDLGARSVVFQLDFESGCKVRTLKPPFDDIGEDMYFLGCMRGVFCYKVHVADERYDYLIFWNPVTGVCRESSDIAWSTSNRVRVRYLFGYDAAATDDLKVVRIMEERLQSKHDCVVYSSKTDSWTRTPQLIDDINEHGKRLTIDMSKPGYSGTHDKVFVEGTNCVHMLATEKKSYYIKVLAFDFRTEKLNLVPVPDNLNLQGGVHLSSLDGCLCLYKRYYTKDRRETLDAWVMKEYGVVESWEHLLSIRLDSDPQVSNMALGFVGIHGRPHLMQMPAGLKKGLFLYDVNQKQLGFQQCELDQFRHATTEHSLFAPTHRQP